MDACLWQVKIDLHQKIKDLTASICNICCSTIQGRYAWFLLIAIAGSHNISYKFHTKCILKFNEKKVQPNNVFNIPLIFLPVVLRLYAVI